jgi:membrane-associated protease RseP (regulator of RpoE activity)
MTGLALAVLAYTAVHEAGHALAALALGLPLAGVSLGVGPVLASVKIRGVSLELRAIPLSGAARFDDRVLDDPRLRSRLAACAAAGPAANVLAAALMSALVPSIVPDGGHWPSPAQLFWLLNAVCGPLNLLLPIPPADGARAVALAFGAGPQLVARLDRAGAVVWAAATCAFAAALAARIMHGAGV